MHRAKNKMAPSHRHLCRRTAGFTIVKPSDVEGTNSLDPTTLIVHPAFDDI